MKNDSEIPRLLCTQRIIDRDGQARGQCSECLIDVWPSIENLAQAQRGLIKLICNECFEKKKNIIFGGVLNKGEKITGEAAKQFMKKQREKYGDKDI